MEEERHVAFDLLSSYTAYGINSVFEEQWLNLVSVLLPPLIKDPTDNCMHSTAACSNRSCKYSKDCLRTVWTKKKNRMRGENLELTK